MPERRLQRTREVYSRYSTLGQVLRDPHIAKQYRDAILGRAHQHKYHYDGVRDEVVCYCGAVDNTLRAAMLGIR